MALDSVHPVPWVLGVSRRGPENTVTFSPAMRMSSQVSRSAPCPPFARMAQPHVFDNCWAADMRSSRLCIAPPDSSANSGRFGVMTAANGKSSAVRAAMASSLRRRAPLVATITGSRTTDSPRWVRSRSAMVRMRAALATIPIFTASGRISSNTASISAAKNFGVASSMAVTPKVFCAVSAVTALMA